MVVLGVALILIIHLLIQQVLIIILARVQFVVSLRSGVLCVHLRLVSVLIVARMPVARVAENVLI